MRLFWPNSVHPHVRVELDVTFWLAFFQFGSSPHARGTAAAPLAGQVVWQFIPACAGNSA